MQKQIRKNINNILIEYITVITQAVIIKNKIKKEIVCLNASAQNNFNYHSQIIYEIYFNCNFIDVYFFNMGANS